VTGLVGRIHGFQHCAARLANEVEARHRRAPSIRIIGLDQLEDDKTLPTSRLISMLESDTA
jgi:hypothetical protein